MNDTDELFMEGIIERFRDEDCDGPVRTGATQCEDSPLHVLLLGQGFIFVFCLAIIGNCLNLFIYNSDHIRYYLAIRMLSTRLMMNTLTMLCLLPQALRLLHVWDVHSPIEIAYWKLWPYSSFFGNLFGFCAIWLTVLMIGECYLHIFLPARSKAVCTLQNLRKCYVIITVVGVALALIYPVNRTPLITTDKCNRDVVLVKSTFNSSFVEYWELAHTLGNIIIALLLPLCLLVFMTISIFCKIRVKANQDTKQHFSAEKRSVTRLTLITTGLQMADSPSVFVFLYVAYGGPATISNTCTLYSVSLFLGLCNMSISFYSYLLFSPRFRELFIVRFKDLLACIVPCSHSWSNSKRRPSRNIQGSKLLSPSNSAIHNRTIVTTNTTIEEEKLTQGLNSFV